MRLILLSISLIFSTNVFCQSHLLHGKIINSKQEPLAFASIQVKEIKLGTVTKEDGTWSLDIDEGKYDLIITLIGYKPQVLTVVVTKTGTEQNIIMELEESSSLKEVLIKGKDGAEDYIRNVIRHKDEIEKAAGAYSCKIYIKAFQQDSLEHKKKKKDKNSDSLAQAKKTKERMNQTAMAEIVIQLDHGGGKSIKEERTGVTKRGNADNLFFLSSTAGDFSFYNNLVNIPSISQTPFLSPLSYSGLLAYRFKILKTQIVNGLKQYTISVKPRQLSNTTVEGEITILDSLWIVTHTKFSLPKYHLAEYDFFEVEQDYSFINDTAWMITRQQFTYNAASGKRSSSGHTVVTYKDFELNKQFEKKHFGVELSSASQQAYERDSIFWQTNRTEPLTAKEIHFINYKDSVFRATHTEAYLDSMDAVVNKITWQKILYKGQEFNNHKKSRKWTLSPLLGMYDPFQFGGARLIVPVYYNKTYKSKKNIFVSSDLSYGFRNHDINGEIRMNRMYNPFNRGFYSAHIGKDFEYIFEGDAWINMLKRSNVYLNQTVGFGHGLELANGLFFYSDIDMAFRRSVSDYKTNDKVDSLFGDILENNQALDFPSYNALYGTFRLEYTPRQRYIREPKEKIILGSAWPTFYTSWRKGISGIFNSKVNFDYLEFGIKQSFKLGLLGTSSYTVKTGSFLNTNDLRLVDYKYQRQGDPILFSNPNEAFQSLDSTFPVFKRFYEGHYVHEFNGAIINKIPFLKKLGLREIAGFGVLFAPERNNLRYAEAFAGIERVFKYPFNQLGKFKVGVYVTGSAANQFRNPVQFKIGITTWDRRRRKWF